MDLFTHVLVAYLLSFGLWGPTGLQYIAAGALAGGLPDADALFFPLARRFPLLRHHGITHSITGVTIVALAGAFLVPIVLADVLGSAFAAGSWVLYFLAMEAGGLSHVFLDGFTHYAVPPFAPFSEWEFHLDADRAINLGTLAFTGFSFWLMIYERGRVPVAFWEATAWLLLAVYGTYLSVRGIGRWRAGIVQRREGYRAVIPRGNPFVFLLADDRIEGGRRRLRTADYRVLSGAQVNPRTLEFGIGEASGRPVSGVGEALERSYGPSLKEGWVLAETHHFAEVREAPDHFTVFWYSLEFSMLGRAAGVLARVDSATGAVVTKSAWMSPARVTA
ncbi:MAG TPA: metal-dependent hydrolase [Thermoplasmata archaeon]|nr:metal-dependent hydrolase [Thermoplasmata archaeon]